MIDPVKPRCWALWPAAGAGQRMGSAIPKQYLPLHARPVIVHALETLLNHPHVLGGVVAISLEDTFWPEVAATVTFQKPLWVTTGGATRAHSVQNGLQCLQQHAQPDDWVLVHDAARPCLAHDDLDRLITALADDPVGGLLAMPVRDTIKQANVTGRVTQTIDRSALWHALTPQMFQLARLQEALSAALSRGDVITDEASAIEAAGFTPRLVEGRADNLKITRPEDLALAEFYLAHRNAHM